MMGKFFVYITAIYLLCTFAAQAQSSSKQNQIKAYYSNALSSLKNQRWNEALTNIENAQNLTGQNLAAFELLRIRAYLGKNDLARAKTSIELFHSLNPNESQKRQVAPYVSTIASEIENSQTRYAALWEQEKRRRAKEKAEKERIDAKMASINVGKEAFSLASSMRRAILNENYFVGDLYLRTEFKGSVYEKGIGGTEVRNGRLVEKQPEITRYSYKIHLQELPNEITSAYGSKPLKEAELRLTLKTEASVVPGSCQIRKSIVSTAYKLKVDVRATDDLLGEVRFFINSSKIRDQSLYLPLLEAFEECDISMYRDGRNQGTQESAKEKVNNEHLEYVEKKIDRLQTNFTLTENQKLAYKKDQEEFELYFVKALFRKQSISFSALNSQINNTKADLLAKADKARAAEAFKQSQLSKIAQLKKEADPLLIRNEYQQVLDNYQKMAKIYESIGEDQRVIWAMIADLKERKLKYEQHIYTNLIDKAMKAIEAGDLDQTESLLKEAKSLTKKNRDVQVDDRQGTLDRQVSRKKDERDEAIQYAQEFDPENYIAFGYVEERLKKAISYEPDNLVFKKKLERYYYGKKRKLFDPLISRGKNAERKNEISKAISYYEQALEILPNEAIGLESLARAKNLLENKKTGKVGLIREIEKEIQNGDKFDEDFLAKIRRSVQDHLKDYPNDVELLVAATTLYIKEKLGLEEAYEMAQKAFDINPGNLENLKNLGDLYYANNDLPKAMDFYKKAIDLPKPLLDEVLQKLTQGHFTLALRTKNKEFETLAVEYANMGKHYAVEHPVFDRVIKHFCPANENCKN